VDLDTKLGIDCRSESFVPDFDRFDGFFG